MINLDPSTFELSFILQNGSLHRWEINEDAYRTVSFKDYTFTMNLGNMLPQGAAVRKRAFEMDRAELSKAMSSADPDRQYELLLEIYKKISIPLASLAFVLLTVPLGIRRKVEGKFSGIIYSLLLFVLYYVLMALTENVGKTMHLPAILTAFIPNVIIALFGVYLVRNLNEEEQTRISQTMRYMWVRYLEKTK